MGPEQVGGHPFMQETSDFASGEVKWEGVTLPPVVSSQTDHLPIGIPQVTVAETVAMPSLTYFSSTKETKEINHVSEGTFHNELQEQAESLQQMVSIKTQLLESIYGNLNLKNRVLFLLRMEKDTKEYHFHSNNKKETVNLQNHAFLWMNQKVEVTGNWVNLVAKN